MLLKLLKKSLINNNLYSLILQDENLIKLNFHPAENLSILLHLKLLTLLINKHPPIYIPDKITGQKELHPGISQIINSIYDKFVFIFLHNYQMGTYTNNGKSGNK